MTVMLANLQLGGETSEPRKWRGVVIKEEGGGERMRL